MHNVEKHVNDPPTLSRQKISNSLKRKAEASVTERPSKLIRNEIDEQGDDDLTGEDLTRLRKNLSAAKLRSVPSLPKTTSNLHEKVAIIDTTTKQGEDYL